MTAFFHFLSNSLLVCHPNIRRCLRGRQINQQHEWCGSCKRSWNYFRHMFRIKRDALETLICVCDLEQLIPSEEWLIVQALRFFFFEPCIVIYLCNKIHISSLVDGHPAIDQTAYMDAWMKCHKTACTGLPEYENLDVRKHVENTLIDFQLDAQNSYLFLYI